MNYLPHMRITTVNGLPHFIAESIGPVAIYLDNDSLIQLAKGPAPTRDRFLEALRAGGTFLFSFTNAAELAGPQGASADAVRAFLNAVGPRWIPLEMDPRRVMNREQQGAKDPAISLSFIEGYFKQRAFEASPDGHRIVDLSADRFFELGAVVDWVGHMRPRIRAWARELDDTLSSELEKLRLAYQRDSKSLDRVLPPLPFDLGRPATFVWVHLLRTLVIEAKAYQFKKNDGLDFCHAVVAGAYASIATLDKQWKRRVDGLPKPNQVARVFYRPEIDEFVQLFEEVVANVATSNHPAV